MPVLRDQDGLPLIPHRMVDFIRFRSPYCHALTADILDRYYDLRLRKVDTNRTKQIHSCINNSLKNPKLIKLLADAELGCKINEAYVVPSANIKTKRMTETFVYFDMETIDGTDFPEDREGRNRVECGYFFTIAKILANEEWYKDLSSNDRMDSKKKGDAIRLHVKLAYVGIVPDPVVIGMHYRACTTFCPLLEPLVFFWHSTMTDTRIDADYGQEVSNGELWLSLERTALLVIFFLQHCRLIPNLVKDTNIFERTNVTWQHVKDWDAGKPFYSLEFYKEAEKKARKSPVKQLNLGELFAMMLRFYVFTCPIGKGKFDFDNGKFKIITDSNKETLEIDSSLIQFPTDEEDKFTHKSLFAEVLHEMLVEVRLSKSGTPGDDLIKLRRQLIAEKIARKQASSESARSNASRKKH